MEAKTRYSDEELQEFKELIMEKLEEANADYEDLREVIESSYGNDLSDTSPSTLKNLSESAAVQSREESIQLADRLLKFINSLQNALVRIENKTYGICRETGKLIPKERLRVVPHATLSIEAKNAQSK